MTRDPSEIIADFFQELVHRPPETRPDWSHGDEVVWHVVSTRCEIDINGFEGVFEQLLDAGGVDFLIAALAELGESTLAGAFAAAHSLLLDAGFKAQATSASDLPEGVQRRLTEIGNSITDGNRLWEIDDKLAALIGRKG
jgi:hypothetical protein